jgi:hypothetical protein
MKAADWASGGTEGLQRIERTFWHSGAQTLSSKETYWLLWFKLKFNDFPALAQRHKTLSIADCRLLIVDCRAEHGTRAAPCGSEQSAIGNRQSTEFARFR